MIKTNTRRIFAFLLSFCLFVSATVACQLPSYATNQDKIDDYKDKIEDYQEKIDAAQDKIDSLKGDIGSVKEYIQELDGQIAMYQSQIDTYQLQIDAYQLQIEDYEAQNVEYQNQITALNNTIDSLNAEIETKNAEIDAQYEELKSLIRSNYINGEASAIEVLLCSEDFADYLTKVQFLSSIADYEKGLITDINADIAEINEKVKQIDTEKAAIATLQAEIDKKIEEIKTEIQNKISENSNYLSSLNNQSAEYENMIAEYEAEIERFDQEIEKLLQTSGSSGDGMLENSTGLICPLQYSGRYISSPFYRNSDGSYHGALDICVYGGTYGLNISAIVNSITNKVSYVVEEATGLKVSKVNVFVDGMKTE